MGSPERPAGEIHRPDVRPSQRGLHLVTADAHDEIAPEHTAAHPATAEKHEAAHHAALGDARAILQNRPDAVGQLLVVGHGPLDAPNPVRQTTFIPCGGFGSATLV